MTDGGSRRRGRGHGQRLLYWFRTPPGVRVGRAAIDEHAMRLLEQHNPDIEFDWARLLKEAPADQQVRRERDRDPRERDRRDRREGRDLRGAPRQRPADTTAAAVPPAPPALVHDAEAQIAEERAEAHANLVLEKYDAGHLHTGEESGEPREPVEPRESGEPREPVEPVEPGEPVSESLAVTHGEPLAADHAEYVEFAQVSGAIAKPDDSPAATRLGADGLKRLRARYAQLVVRLADKPLDDELRAELKLRLERLNPDAWMTTEEVAAALEQYESVFESLRAHVGHHPRRKL